MRFLEKILVVEVSKKRKCDSSLVVWTALKKKKKKGHFMCFLKLESDCCMWVWLCVWVNPCTSEGCSLMWQVQTAAGPLARPKAPLRFIRNEADLNAGRCLLLSLQTEEVRPSNSGKAEAEPGAGTCFSRRSCVKLGVLCRGFICAPAVAAR